MEKAKRYLIFLLGLFLSSLGVSLVTKADLGTSPISAIPYVLSLKFPLTLGQFTIAFSLLLIFLQLLILRRRFRLEHLLQIPISIAFGYFIDLTMGLLFFVSPGSYPEKVLYLLAGCAVLAFGVYLEVLADVAMLPGESFVRAVVLTWNTDFGTTKVCFDVSMTAIAVAASLILSGHLAGVREGTLVAALLVGFLARTFGRMLSFLPGLLFPPQEEDAPKPAAGRGYVIAIGRQYGSGGRIIGRLLADRLNYQFYDEEIIQLTAGTTGFTPQFVHQQEESMTSPCSTTLPIRCTTPRSRRPPRTPSLPPRSRPFCLWPPRATACWWAAAPTGCCATTPTVCGCGSTPTRRPVSTASWTPTAWTRRPPTPRSNRETGSGPPTTSTTPAKSGATRKTSTWPSTPPLATTTPWT